MKHKFVLLIFTTVILLSCGNGKNESSVKTGSDSESKGSMSEDNADKTGTFSFNGRSVTGKVTTQYFGSDKATSNFSVLCQYDEAEPKDRMNPDFALLQITFLNEKDATTNPDLKLYPKSILPMTDPEPGIVTVSLSGSTTSFQNKRYSGSSSSTGSIKVVDRQIIISDMKLFVLKELGNDEVTVNAKIPF